MCETDKQLADRYCVALESACKVGFDDGCPVEELGVNPYDTPCTPERCEDTPCWRCWMLYFLQQAGG